MKQIVQLVYASVPNRLYALCDDGSLYHRSEAALLRPWIREEVMPSDPELPVIQDVSTQEDLGLPEAPKDRGLNSLLGTLPSERGASGPEPLSESPSHAPSSSAFLAPGQVPTENQPGQLVSPIIPQK